MLLKNKAVKAIAGAVILSCIMGGNVYAASSPTSVVIYSNDRSATSTSINCTGYIDGYGVNDVSSTRSLYYTLRKKGNWKFRGIFSSYVGGNRENGIWTSIEVGNHIYAGSSHEWARVNISLN